jgi:outer membrane protein OmpA-like peptidoglycan-associated protein
MRFTVNTSAAMALLAMTVPAGAQILPAATNVNWGGPYVGLGIGGAWGQLPGRVSVGSTPAGAAPGSAAVPGSTRHLYGSTNATVTGGGDAGYNWQFDNFVLGVEGDINGGGLSTTTGVPPGGLSGMAPGSNFKASSDWNASIRGRVGYAWNQWLLYGTGGVAFADANLRTNFAGGTAPDGTALPGSHTSKSTTLVGPTYGGGIEYAMTPNLSVGAEYRYTDYGRDTFSLGNVATTGAGGAAATAPATGTVGLRDNTVMFKVNYHFVTPPPPPMPAAAPAPPPPPAPRVFIVFFDWDKDVITPEGHQIIQQAADAYKSGAPVQLQVTGYTDRSGSPGYNQRLSERRANNVARALAALGVPRNEMVVSGRGENDNRVPTAAGVREPQNRRVEITAP